jgi:hypothetical protein
MSMPVNTAKVECRRQLNYTSFEELLADADRLSAGPVKALGNWSAGQVFRHLALAYSSSIDGFTVTFPWYLRLMGKIFRKKLLAGPMPAGYKLPPSGAKTLEPPPISTAEGLADLHAAVARLQQTPHRARHPMFGQVTKEQWDKIHLAHASLHMSFLVPLPNP